ncbi:MAG: phosphoribosylaminoimidazolesuccinocarboxamide synthase [Rhodothermales bacterium]
MPVDKKVIASHLDKTVFETHLDHLGDRYRGKVRDTYARADRLILVTTDRVSAFDHVLRQTIPFKGQVLNRLAAFFFESTSDIVRNHVLAIPDPNVTLALRCEPVPVEFVVRGYLAGHAWREYRSGKRELCGEPLPDGLRQNEQLPEPILTPATKAVTGHDEDVSRKETIARGILDEPTFEHLKTMALAVFERGSKLASERGLILVDTKYEFGRAPDGAYVLIDEVHTPDSSRYFYADSYADLLREDKPQRQLSKEFLREWLIDHGFQGCEGEVLPDLPDAFRVEVAARYIELFERVTGKEFEPAMGSEPEARIASSIEHALTI